MSRSVQVLLLFLCIYLHSTTEAGPSTKGSEFHFLFGPNTFAQGEEFDPQILVTTNESQPVNFWISWNKGMNPKAQSNTTHNVSRGEVEIINIPLVLSINTNNPRTPDIGIQLQSQDGKELTVVGVNEQQASTDAFLVFPKIETKSKTYEYFALSVEKGPFPNVKSFFGFVTTEPNTTITITHVSTRIITLFVRFIVLNPGTNYTATVPAAGTSVAGTATSDLSGTRIVSDKPLSFFTGHECGLIPSDETACDHLVEQVPPTETWGFQFFLVPLSTRSGDGYRILASRGGTECNVTCTDASLSETITLANPGDFRQLIYTNRYCSVECNRPVLIFQFSLGHSYDDVAKSDPFAVMIPPVGQYSNDYDLVFFESKEVDTRGETVVFDARINIAIPAEYDPSGLRFDGSPLSGAVKFVDVTCRDGEVCGRVAQYNPTSDTGSHKLEHIDPNARFTATVYGWERENTYGYIGGMNFDSIAAEIFCFKDRTSSASESDGTASFVVTRSGSAADRSCIGYTVGDMSTQGAADYSNTSGECCFEVNQKETTCTIQLVVDTVTEDDEVLRIELAPKTGQCVCEAPGTTTDITITEMVEPPVFAFERDRYEVNEAAGTVRIGVVKQSGDIISGESVTIDVTPRQGSGQRDGADPATEGVDYTSYTQQVVFQSNDSIQYFSCPITNDSVPERTEYFYVDMAISAGSGTVGAPNTTTVFITEEVKPPVFVFERDRYEVNEAAGTVRIGVVKQSGDIISGENVTIDVTPRQGSGQISGADPATEVVDYTSYTQQVVFQSNDSIQYFSCPITNDSVPERTEYFYVDMAISAGSGTVGAPNTTTVFITEEVEPPVFAFERDRYEVNETAGTVRIGVVKQFGDIISGESVTIDVTPRQGSGEISWADPATEGVDYNWTIPRVVFQSSDSIQYVEIPITDDGVFERTEYFYVDLTISAGSGSVGAPNTTTVFITEEGNAIRFEREFYRTKESVGDFKEVRLVADQPFAENTSVNISFEDISATGGVDYENDSVVITFEAGSRFSTNASIPIILDSDADEGDEQFNATFELPDGYRNLNKGDPEEAVITIENVVTEIIVEFNPTKYNVSEGDGFVLLTLVSSTPIDTEYTVEVLTQDGTANAGDDYLIGVTPFSATFASGETSATVLIPIRNDSVLEGLESFFAGLSIPGPAASLGVKPGERDNATVYIDDDDSVEVVFDPISYDVSESDGEVTLTLRASSTASFDYTVRVDTSDRSATGGDDYTSGGYEVTFPAGSSTAQLTINITDDDIAELTERFTAHLSVSQSVSDLGVSVGSDDTATVNIEDNDVVAVEFRPFEYTVSESDEAVELILVADKEASFDYTVEVTTADLTASAGSDYTGVVQGNATFRAGETNATVQVPILEDDDLEERESFVANLSIPDLAASLGVLAGPRDSATVTIEDNDGVVVVFDPIAYNVSEGDGEVTLTLRASSNASFDYTVRVDTSDISATGGKDYTSGGYEVTFPAGSSTAQLMIDITDDDIAECTETFTATLSIPSEVSNQGISRGANNVATVSIIDNDPAEINFVPTEYTVLETGDKVNLTLKSTKVLSFACSLIVSTSDGTAQESLDYSGLDEEMFTIPADSDSVVVMVTLFDDNIFDCTTENFSVNFVVSGECAACGVSVGDGMATVNIEDNDVITVQFGRTTYIVEEGNVTADLEVIVDKEFECQFNVPVNTEDGNATAAKGDYVAGGYVARFLPGSQTSTVPVDIRDDSEQEGDEYFRARLSLPEDLQNGTVQLGPSDTANIVIVDEGVVRVWFAPDMYSVTEGDGFVTITLKSSGPADQDYIVNVKTSDRSATSPEDYTGGTYQVTFEAGKTTAQFNVSINDDNVCEREETFVAMLEIPAESNVFGIMAGTPSEATVKILDDDVVEVQFNPKYYVVNESDGEVTLTLECGTCAHSYNVSLECFEGSAQDFLDYSVPSPLVTMCSPGSSRSFVDISITDNTLNEPTENFTCRITDVPEGVTPGPDDEATVDIIDNDPALVVNFNPVEYSVVENDGSVLLTVVASGPSSEQYSVFVDTSDGPDPSATGGDDYSEGPHEVVFPPGITSTTVSIGITRDSDCECDEIFVGRLRVPDGSDVSVGTNDTATITIKNDDECQLVFDPPTYMVDENAGSVEVCVRMDKNCVGAFVLPLNTADGPNEDRRAMAVNDYEAGPYTISFAEGQTRACTDIPIVDDDVHEPDQDFTVSMEVPSGLPLRPGENATVTITDDDTVRCMVGEGSIVVLESDGVISLNVTIDREIEEPVMCEVITQPGTAKDDTDFNPFMVLVTFEPQGRRTQPVSLQIIDDDRSEPIEDLQVGISFVGVEGDERPTPAEQPAIKVTIIDDDTHCSISEGGLLRTFLNESMYRFTNMCPYELISTCPQGGEEPIPFQIHIDIVNGNLASAKVAIEYEASTVVIAEDGRVTRIGSDITVSERGGRVIAHVEALDITVTRTFGVAGSIGVSVSNSSDLLSQLCGLCGNSEGLLSFKDQTVASPDNAEQLSMFIEEYRVPRGEQIFSELSSECVEELQVRNDTVIGDPLYEVPLRLSSELMNEYGEISLCYEVHGRANAVFNLISDVCVSVNAHYTPMIDASMGNVINQIGILAEDNSGQCQRIEVNLTGCAASVNGVGVTNYDQDGIHVIRRSQSQRLPRVRVSVPNCDNHEVVMWVVCEQMEGQPMIKFVVARGHNLSPTSHGLIAQFWNIDVSAERYNVLKSDRINASDTHFAVTVRPPNGDARRFFAEIHPKTWNKDKKYCLYAGNGQGGRVFEVPSLPDPVIEGRYFNYRMRGLFATRYQYSRFTSDCNAEDTV